MLQSLQKILGTSLRQLNIENDDNPKNNSKHIRQSFRVNNNSDSVRKNIPNTQEFVLHNERVANSESSEINLMDKFTGIDESSNNSFHRLSKRNSIERNIRKSISNDLINAIIKEKPPFLVEPILPSHSLLDYSGMKSGVTRDGDVAFLSYCEAREDGMFSVTNEVSEGKLPNSVERSSKEFVKDGVAKAESSGMFSVAGGGGKLSCRENDVGRSPESFVDSLSLATEGCSVEDPKGVRAFQALYSNGPFL